MSGRSASKLDQIYYRLKAGEVPDGFDNYMSAAMAELYDLDMSDEERAAAILSSAEWRNISVYAMNHDQSVLILAIAKKCGVLQ